MYAGLESGMVAARGTDDWVISIVSGLYTGALFKAANGPRSASVAGAIGGLMVGTAFAGKQDRNYKSTQNRALVPEFRGRMVTGRRLCDGLGVLLADHISHLTLRVRTLVL